MAWAIITIYTSKCAQQVLNTSKFYFRCKKCEIEKTLGGWVPPPLVARRLNEAKCFSSAEFEDGGTETNEGAVKKIIKRERCQHFNSFKLFNVIINSAIANNCQTLR